MNDLNTNFIVLNEDELGVVSGGGTILNEMWTGVVEGVKGFVEAIEPVLRPIKIGIAVASYVAKGDPNSLNKAVYYISLY